jgi:predicted nucleotidyltransferase
VLFGSHARGDADAWSDVDLLIVCPTERRFFARPELFTDVLEAFPGL